MFINRVMRTFSHDLAIDLGTSNTVIYMKNKGIVLNEPSVVALRKNDSGADKVIAVGREAKMMLGRNPAKIETIRPIRDGVIAEFDIAETMLRHFIKEVHRRRRLIRPRIIIALPMGVTQVEKKAVFECAKSAGASDVFLIEEPIAAAIGAGLPITEPIGNVVVDIGAGTTEVAVISLGGIVYSRSARVAGDKMDEAIMQHVNRKYNFLIGPGTAEKIKINIGSALPTNTMDKIEVRGRDLLSGIPMTLTLGSEEVRQMTSEEVKMIVQTVRSAMEQMLPELSADILSTGILLTGGGALLKDLDRLLAKEIGVPATVVQEPLYAVAVGAGKALDNLSVMSHFMIG
jgi:rod shape-determining protein MreB